MASVANVWQLRQFAEKKLINERRRERGSLAFNREVRLKRFFSGMRGVKVNIFRES